MLRYAITDRRAFSGDERLRSAAVAASAKRWAEAGIEFVQIREKDLSEADLILLAKRFRASLPMRGGTRLLVNAPLEMAVRLAVGSGADGIHVPLRDLASLAAAVWTEGSKPMVSVSCHALEEVRLAEAQGADLILFGPVFEKRVGGEVVRAGVGVGALRQAATLAPGRVLALGGVASEYAAICVEAGAVGVAGIRMFAGLQGDAAL